MGSPKVEALFSGEPPPPPARAEPIVRRLRRILAVAVPLDLAGVFCWTGVPGAALTLWAWLIADAQMVGIEDGLYTQPDADQLLRYRRIAAYAMAFCVLSLIFQAWLLSTNFYEVLFAAYSRWLEAVLPI